MTEVGSALCFKTCLQDTASYRMIQVNSFAGMIQWMAHNRTEHVLRVLGLAKDQE